MTDPTLIADLIRAGLCPDLVARVWTAIASTAVARGGAQPPDYLKHKTFVYALVDPRDYEWFYIGISISPDYRLKSHRKDPSSAAFRRIKEIEADGFEIEMDIVGEYDDRNDALKHEHRLITGLDGLVNRSRQLSQVFQYQ